MNASQLSKEELEFAMSKPEDVLILRITKALERIADSQERIAVAQEAQVPK